MEYYSSINKYNHEICRWMYRTRKVYIVWDNELTSSLSLENSSSTSTDVNTYPKADVRSTKGKRGSLSG